MRRDERNHIEKPFLYHFDGLGWKIIDLDGTLHMKSEVTS